jgi:hypothetical protein
MGCPWILTGDRVEETTGVRPSLARGSLTNAHVGFPEDATNETNIVGWKLFCVYSGRTGSQYYPYCTRFRFGESRIHLRRSLTF